MRVREEWEEGEEDKDRGEGVKKKGGKQGEREEDGQGNIC